MNESVRPLGVRLLFGVLLLSLGLLWTADNLGLLDAHEVLRWWPALILLFGLARLTGWGGERNVVVGVLCTVMGGLMIGNEIGWVHAGLGLLFPLALVALGVQILMRGARASSPAQEPAAGDGSDYVRSFALMGGASTRSTSQALRGAELSAIMGGVELDLREAKPADGVVRVDAFAFMGGIDLVVGPGWTVEFEATPILGGLQDNRGPLAGSEPVGRVQVHGTVVMGGIQVTDEPTGRTVVVGVSRRRRRDRDRGIRTEVRVGPRSVHVRESHEDDEPYRRDDGRPRPGAEPGVHPVDPTPPVEPR